MSDSLQIMLEQSILAMLLKDNNNYDKINRLETFHFQDESHKVIFKEIKLFLESGHPANILTLSGVLINKGIPNEYLKELLESATIDFNIDKYADILVDNYNKQSLVEFFKIAEKKIEEGISIKEIIDNIFTEIYKLTVNNKEKTTVNLEEAFNEISKSIQDNNKNKERIWTRFDKLDDIIGDLKPGNLLIIGGRPSAGKTSLATSIAINIATEGNGVVFISMEMTYTQIATKILSSLAQINTINISNQNLNNNELIKCLDTIDCFNKLKIFIHDTSNLNIGNLKQLIRFFKRNYGIKVFIIDYLQLIKSGKKIEKEREELAEVTRELKLMSKELEISMIALCQLSREIDKTGTPLLSHLSGSARLEQEADIVVIILKQDNEKIVKLHVIKNRHGRDGTCQLSFDGSTSTFHNILN